MSKHGYKVENHWFKGVCGGHKYDPIQDRRDIADMIVSQVRAQVAELRREVDWLQSGKMTPETAWSGRYEVGSAKHVDCPFADAPVQHQREAVKSAIFFTILRANSGESFADAHERLINEVHGTPLKEVTIADAPPRIHDGEKRQSARGILTARSVDGATVRWKDQNGYRGAMSTRSWRALSVVPQFAVPAGGSEIFTLESMLEANKDDEALCAWLRTAEVGQLFPDGETTRRVA